MWDYLTVNRKPVFHAEKGCWAIHNNYITLEQRGILGINLESWPILKVAPDMPAQKAGVRDGDIAIRVNGDSISHVKSTEDAMILLFGKIGDKVTLTVKREEQLLTFEVERGPLSK